LIRGTAQPQLNVSSLREIKIPIPNLEKQKKIVAN
jgi:restriction endonuclease S subunit